MRIVSKARHTKKPQEVQGANTLHNQRCTISRFPLTVLVNAHNTSAIMILEPCLEPEALKRSKACTSKLTTLHFTSSVQNGRYETNGRIAPSVSL